jgi:hypothetical protein
MSLQLYIITQPAFLTNYQQYYTALRQGLNTSALEEKLRRSVAELDALVEAEDLRQTEVEQRKKKEQEKLRKENVELLTMLAEMVALPYYLYNLLEHIDCLHGYAGYLTFIATVVVVAKTQRNMRGKSA